MSRRVTELIKQYQRRLILRRHGREVVIGAIGREAQRSAARARTRRLGCQRAGDELEAVVEPRRGAVHRADERALAAADHAHA